MNTARLPRWQRRYGQITGWHLNISLWTRAPRFIVALWRGLDDVVIVRMK